MIRLSIQTIHSGLTIADPGVTSPLRGLAMRWTMLLCLFALLSACAANDVSAQRRGGVGHGFARRGGVGSGLASRGHRFRHARSISPYGIAYPYLPYDSGDPYVDASQPDLFDQQRSLFVQPPSPPEPPVVELPGHAVILEYKWPTADAASSPSAPSTNSEAEPQAFAIVLKDGSTVSALTIFASDDDLHYVDPDARHLRISMREIDRAATLKLNRARNLNLYLPAVE
jgi:hypothetical protein